MDADVQPAEVHTNKKAGKPMLWLVLFLLLIVVLAYVVILVPQNKTAQKSGPVNWKIYTNDKEKFSIKYPENYKIAKQDSKKIVFDGEIPGEFTILLTPEVDIQQLQNCKFVKLGDQVKQCVDGAIEIKSYTNSKMNLYNVKSGSSENNFTMDYIGDTTDGSKIQFKERMTGGGSESRAQDMLSTFSNTK